MNPGRLLLVASWLLLTAGARAGVLSRSDVVFMYQADAPTYAAYGATVLAWGGQPTPAAREAARGVRFFASVGMVTEFARYHERFPDTYEEGLCRDIQGRPVKVPWLTDHQHQGIPFWWCCTQQPQFRQYLRERVSAVVRAGADGVHIDDHLGTAGSLWLGTCFCARCVEGFRAHLLTVPSARLQTLGVADVATFDFREAVRAWMGADAAARTTPTQHPLWEEWSVYQARAAAAFMVELHALANQEAGRPLPMGANAGLLWPRHLADYQAIDLFSAETDHHAEARRFSDAPLLAYRLADAVGRPYAATASGGDWAFIKEQNLPGLVRGWIALGYAAGHSLMAPHRQWCHTPEKGTHWYSGPTARFAPLYQFVRQHRGLFDDFENRPDLLVVMPHRAYIRDTARWTLINRELAAANLSYRLALGGDAIVARSLQSSDFRGVSLVLAPEQAQLEPADREVLARETPGKRVVSELPEALALASPAVKLVSHAPVRCLVRARRGEIALHVLNQNYQAKTDDVEVLPRVELLVDPRNLGVAADAAARLYRAEGDEEPISIRGGRLVLEKLGLWSVLVIPGLNP